MVPSPKALADDLKPEMSADGVAERSDQKRSSKKLVRRDRDEFRNADMVGHSGKMEPTVKAVETVDTCLGRIYTRYDKRAAHGLSPPIMATRKP